VTSDDDLILETGRGSRTAFEELFERYRDPIWRFFRRRTSDAGTAEELAQDTFVAIMEGAHRYRQRGTFRSYLFGTAYNLLQADRRRTTARAADPLDADPPAPATADPDAEIWVRSAMATLDADDREILMLREYEQLSYQEIADVRGTPINTVRSQLFRARMALKAALELRTPHPLRTNHAGR
jgi:RNA polymerase sigma-70 factor (ECF subfamily)